MASDLLLRVALAVQQSRLRIQRATEHNRSLQQRVERTREAVRRSTARLDAAQHRIEEVRENQRLTSEAA